MSYNIYVIKARVNSKFLFMFYQKLSKITAIDKSSSKDLALAIKILRLIADAYSKLNVKQKELYPNRTL